jgi:hypothetical protein
VVLFGLVLFVCTGKLLVVDFLMIKFECFFHVITRFSKYLQLHMLDPLWFWLQIDLYSMSRRVFLVIIILNNLALSY